MMMNKFLGMVFKPSLFFLFTTLGLTISNAYFYYQLKLCRERNAVLQEKLQFSDERYNSLVKDYNNISNAYRKCIKQVKQYEIDYSKRVAEYYKQMENIQKEYDELLKKVRSFKFSDDKCKNMKIGRAHV